MSAQRRAARIQRRTAETQIELELGLDGSGQYQVETGIGFFDHMLAAFARHGNFDLKIRCQGDLEVDAHHTVEDVGICLGQAMDQALGDKQGIQRYGHSYVPMDEALARVVVDLSGRSFLAFQAAFADERVGDLPAGLVKEFFRAVADQGRLNLHIDLLRGGNDHHGIEAIFKAFGRALDQACLRSGRVQGIPSTKGAL
jgi:imidazoleglycerol-phosphate dehydratase